MAVHPRLKPILALQRRWGETAETLPGQRLEDAIVARRFGRIVMLPGPKVRTSERMVPVDGGSIRVRLYEPPSAPRPWPVHVFFHGGGWCVGDLDQRDPRCRTIAGEAGCLVVSVDYRLAPENAYPVPRDDCYAALCWVAENATEIGADPERISVGGESAGANLAAVVCLLSRDRGGPAIVFQWLDVPATDLTMSQPSIDALPSGYGLEKEGMIEFIHWYLRDHDPKDPYASPLHADDLSNLPPALVTTAEFDRLRDDGVAYATRLREAGVEVEHRHLDGFTHPAFAFTRLLPEARIHEREAIRLLRAAFAKVERRRQIDAPNES